MTTAMPRLQYYTDQLRASARRALRRRAPPEMNVRTFVFSVIGQSRAHIEFNLVYGGFASARSYTVQSSDDDRKVDETIDRALVDLRADMAALAGAPTEGQAGADQREAPGVIGLALDAAISELNGEADVPQNDQETVADEGNGGNVIDLTARLRTTSRERASNDLVAGEYFSEIVVVMGLVGIAVNEYLATLPPGSFERRRLTAEIEKRARSVAAELDARRSRPRS